MLGLAASAAPAAWAGASLPATTNGGTAYGVKVPAKKPVRKPAAVNKRPLLAKFRVAPLILRPGATPSVTFRVDGRTAQVRLRLVVTWPGTANPRRMVALGRQTTAEDHTVDLTTLADPALPEGVVSVRITGRDTAGRLLRPGAHLSRVQQIEVRAHVFPLQGTFSYGDAGARFGAQRDGHTHQGQDLFAAAGTPAVAVRSGTIDYVEYQADGAGYYVVLSADGEDYDYAYMHLKEGSIQVVQGQHVAARQQLAGVGHTGDAIGDHLHFEVWQGAWYDGGHVVDPLPFLQQWQAWSPVSAT